jgi:hypothetical protein
LARQAERGHVDPATPPNGGRICPHRAKRSAPRAGTIAMPPNRVLTKEGLTWHVVSVLRRLGYRASARPVAGERYNHLASNTRNRTQISVGGTLTDYPALSNIIQTWLSCDSSKPESDLNANRAGFCDASVDAAIERAFALETSDPKAANGSGRRSIARSSTRHPGCRP